RPAARPRPQGSGAAAAAHERPPANQPALSRTLFSRSPESGSARRDDCERERGAAERGARTAGGAAPPSKAVDAPCGRRGGDGEGCEGVKGGLRMRKMLVGGSLLALSIVGSTQASALFWGDVYYDAQGCK